MRAIINKLDGTVELKGSVITLATSGEGGDRTEERVAAVEVAQLMRSRKDERVARMVSDGGKVYLLQFGDVADREAFIDAVVAAQSAGRADAGGGGEGAEQWVAQAICQAAVDVGALSREELQGILSAESHRGVVQAFDALETLVDRDTFRLKPLTESMENDVLRQIPVLALLFEQHVMDEETKRSFWEAVVRKYFCFSRTFLEEELGKVEPPAAAAAPAPALAPSSSGTSAGEANLASINSASWRAMPKRPAAAAAAVRPSDDSEEDSEEARAVRASEAAQSAAAPVDEDRFVALFRSQRRLPRLQAGGADAQVEYPPTSRPRIEAGAVFRGENVSRTAPQELTHKDTLEALRRFWRSGGAKQRRAVLDAYDTARGNKSRQDSFLEAACLRQAREVAKGAL